MTVSILDLHCLNAVTDDYENVASILEEVRRTSHGNVSMSEVVAALEEMACAGLLAPYSLEPHGQGFVPADQTGKDLSSLWFRITPAGLAELEANWVDG
jgi:hypothetical protein